MQADSLFLSSGKGGKLHTAGCGSVWNFMIHSITSKDNPKIKLAASLQSRSKRREHGLFLFEGLKLLFEAYGCGLEIHSVFVDESKEELFSAAEELDKKGVPVFSVSHAVILKLADSETPSGIVSVARQFEVSPAANIAGGRFIALENISDPGNAGAVLRCAEAFGLDGVIVSRGSVDLFSPKTVRGSMGSVFRVKCYYSENLPEDIKLLGQKGFATFCADLKKDALSLKDAIFPKNSVTVIGNESGGISGEMSEACQSCIYIPMKGRNESLNASVAAGIIAWEMTKGETND